MGYEEKRNKANREKLHKDRSAASTPASNPSSTGLIEPDAERPELLPIPFYREDATTATPPRASGEAIKGSLTSATPAGVAAGLASGEIKFVPSAVLAIGCFAWVGICVWILRDGYASNKLVDWQGFKLLLITLSIATVILIIGLSAFLAVNLISLLTGYLKRRLNL